MRNKRRQAGIAPLDDSEYYAGDEISAKIPVDSNQPVIFGDIKDQFTPTDNPFWQDENILISSKEKSESPGDREARLARRLLILLKR